MWDISTTSEIEDHLAAGAVVAIGVSGGKDSSAVARRVVEYLDQIGHTGPRVLVHSDLGRIEWRDSLPVCERLAERLGLELMVVRRRAGDLMDRFETRWSNNVARYANLECVKLILPWATSALRFCTSELKTSVICSALSAKFPGQNIISVTGIRHQESTRRAKMPIAQIQPKLCRKDVVGYNWNAIIGWSEKEVYSYLADRGETLHVAYSQYGLTRVSCCYCIMSSGPDLLAATRCDETHDVYRHLVDLEIRSTFAFQGARWLGDVAPHLLSPEALDALARAKAGAALRVEAESQLPRHLLYESGWPTAVPTYEEAILIGSVRQVVAHAVEINAGYVRPEEIRGRYAELIVLRDQKEKTKGSKKGKLPEVIPAQQYDYPELALF